MFLSFFFAAFQLLIAASKRVVEVDHVVMGVDNLKSAEAGVFAPRSVEMLKHPLRSIDPWLPLEVATPQTRRRSNSFESVIDMRMCFDGLDRTLSARCNSPLMRLAEHVTERHAS